MLAAAACAWGAAGFLGPRGGLFAGSLLGAGLLLSTEAFIGKTDAVLCGSTTLAMAALSRLYLASRTQSSAGFNRFALIHKLLFWSGLAISVLDKGPIGPMIAGLALLALGLADRRARWMGRLGWAWGLLLVLAVVGPWAIAITVATDGAFWTGSVGGDLAPKLAGGHESHGAAPGLHALISPLLLFPAAALLPAALVTAWRRRREPGVRFALAWLVPAWLVFEAMPTKLPHYPLPLYGALAWLMAAALTEPEAGGASAWNGWTRGVGAALSLLTGALLATVAILLGPKYGASGSPWIWLSAALSVATGLTGALTVLRRGLWRPVDIRLGGIALGLGVLTHMSIGGGLAPALSRLWVSRSAAALVAAKGLDPRNGLVEGPVAVVGYAEPSLVFLLGTETELDSPEDAADAISDGEPALVDRRQDTAFHQSLKAAGTSASRVGETQGLDYSTGKLTDLLLYRSDAPPKSDASPPADDPNVKTAGRPAT